jgi:hypothetical protein
MRLGEGSEETHTAEEGGGGLRVVLHVINGVPGTA